MRSPKDASSGSYSHPIKIEDSDSDDGGLRDNGLAYFSSIANTLEKSPSTQSSTNRFQPSPSQRSKSPDNSHLKEQPNFSQGSEMYEPDEENLKVSPRARYTDRRAGTGGPD